MSKDANRNGETPVRGVPIEPMPEIDTGRIGHELNARIAMAAGQAQATPPTGTMSPDAFLEALANKVAQKVGNGNGNGNGKKPPGFLGVTVGGWTKMLLAWLMAGIVALAAWHLTVRDELRERPTSPQVEETVRGTFEHHNDSSAAHPLIQKRLEKLSTEQVTIRASQVRQETLDETQTKTLERIEKKLDRRNR